MNITEYLLQTAKDNQIAIMTQKEEYTFGYIKAAVSYFQFVFQSLGTKPQDRIGIIGSNSPFWVASYLAAMGIGAIAVPFSPTLTPEDFQKNNACVNCSILCIEQRLYRKYASVISNDIKIIFDDLSETNSARHVLVHNPLPGFDESQDAVYMFTSGTTTYPRVVRITHRNIRANTESIISCLSLSARERVLAILPFYYCFGTSLLHTHLKLGDSVVLPGPMLYPERMLDLLEEKECTGIAGVPSIFQTLLRNTTFPSRKLPKLRKIQQAGGKLSEILIKELINCRPDSEIFIMYGQTEATARLSCLDSTLVHTKMGSIGKGIPGVELRVINEKGEDVVSGEIGEIVAKGDNISPGYLNDQEATAGKFVNGNLKTGDLATVDDDGYIYVVDRSSDFIKSYGNRVSSQQVEACILELKDVINAAAVGVQDLVRGEAIRVFVTLKSGSQLQPEDIIKHAKNRMASHMVPKDVIILENMPTNAHGKIVKSKLRKI